MTVTSDDIAALVLKHYDGLPAKRKPVIRGNGLREWVPLAGIVAQGKDDKLWCLSLATGMKCLPTSKIPQAQGNILHDWHAEVLAIRAFNRFVLDECKVLVQGSSSEFLRWRTGYEISSHDPSPIPQEEGYDETKTEKGTKPWHEQPFTWKEDILLHMYCSEAPCGDASMELIMASQEDSTPWDIPPAALPNINTTTTSTLPGRAYFSQLGIVRRKPSRPDAPTTLSKSCSDKLAQRQCISLLSSITALLVDPSHIYLNTLTLPASRYNATACRRAFSSKPEGRMRSLALRGSLGAGGGYAFHPFTVNTTSLEFAFSQRSVSEPATTTTTTTTNSYTGNRGYNKDTDEQVKQAQAPQKIAPSNISVAWTRTLSSEATLGGVLQGRKQSAADAKGASFASRRKIWGLAVEVADLLLASPLPGQNHRQGDEEKATVGASHAVIESIQGALRAETYLEVKASTLLEPRRRAKDEVRTKALQGWVKNLGDNSFTL